MNAVTIRIPNGLKNAIALQAAKDGRSLNKQLVWLIQRGLEREQENPEIRIADLLAEKPDDIAVIQLRLSGRQKDELERLASSNSRSVNQQARWLLERGLIGLEWLHQ